MNEGELTLIKRRADIVSAFCIKRPSVRLCMDYPEGGNRELQEWILNNLKKKFEYSTGIDVMDAAWNIAESDVNNGSSDLDSELIKSIIKRDKDMTLFL